MIKNKNEIKAFYLTHNLSIKDVAKHFDISYRTLAHWVKSEEWEAGSAVNHINIQDKDIINNNANRVLDIAQVKIKNQIESALSPIDLDITIKENLLQTSTDEILLKTMTINYIQKNIALSAVLAKDALLRLASAQKLNPQPQNEPILIACAEKCAKIFTDMQNAIYGKNYNNEEKNTNDLSTLSIAELNAILKEI